MNVNSFYVLVVRGEAESNRNFRPAIKKIACGCRDFG